MKYAHSPLNYQCKNRLVLGPTESQVVMPVTLACKSSHTFMRALGLQIALILHFTQLLFSLLLRGIPQLQFSAPRGAIVIVVTRG